MSDIVERILNRIHDSNMDIEILLDDCKIEVETLRQQLGDVFDENKILSQRVKELEKDANDGIEEYTQLVSKLVSCVKELAALKQSQGEPIYYEITTHDGIKWVGGNHSNLPNHTNRPLCYCAAAPKPEDVK